MEMWKLINKIFGRVDWEREYSILYNEHEKLLILSRQLLELTDGNKKDNESVQETQP